MKSLLSGVALAAAALCTAAPASAAIVLNFTPSSSQIAVGESVQVVVTLTGLGAEILSAFDLEFVWNTGSVFNSAGSSTLCLQLGPDPFGCGFTGITDGNVGLEGSSTLPDAALAAIQPDTLEIGVFSFLGSADGVTQFTLGPDGDFQRNFIGLNFASLPVSVGSACIAVGTGRCEVPEPASYGLAAIALLAAGVASRTRRRSGTVAA
jgi:hypothetical protein